MRRSVELLQRCGYDGVELLGEPDTYQPAEQVRQLVADHGLSVTALTAASRLETGRDLSSPRPEVRQASIDHLLRCVEFAAAVGCPLVGVAPAAVGRYWLEAEPRQEWAWAVESVTAVAGPASAAGVRLCLEVLNRYVSPAVRTVADALRLVRDCDARNLGITLDTFHASIEERSIAEAVERAGGALLGVQVADNNRAGVGHGSMDFRPLLAALDRIGYIGAVSLEAMPPGGNPFRSTTEEDVPLMERYSREFVPRMRALR